MENSKIVYGSTSDFLKYLNTRTKEKEKNNSKKYNRGIAQFEQKEPVDLNVQSFE
jgi:hypothetical protein